MTRFQTNKRLWLLLTLALWLPWFFLWHIGKAGDTDTPASLLRDSLQELFRHGLLSGHGEDVLGFIFIIAIPLIPAAVIAWVIHCPIVMLTTSRRKTPTDN